MRILIVMPKYSYAVKNRKPNYHYWFPMGLPYIYSVIKKESYDLEAYNLNHECGGIEELMNKKLDEKKYDVVCTGGMSIDYQIIEKIIDTSKSHSSNPLIVLGGSIITSNKELISKNLKFDVGIIGEGEATIVDLLNHLKDKKDIKNVKGICYKKDGEIIFTPQRDPILDLDSIPFPDHEAFGFSKVLDDLSSLESFLGCSGMDYPRTYSILGSRGCPFQCTFCYHSLGPKYRMRSIKNICEELEFAINKYDINSFFLYDDLFSINKERLNEFCKEIKKLDEKYSKKLLWMCQLWVGVVDKEMLKTLKDAGCIVVSFGFESYSSKILKSMKKPITPEQIDNAIKTCFEEHMIIIGNFIFGDLEETKETAQETINYWKKNCNGQVKLFFIHPYPGSEIYQSCLDRGIIADELNFIKNEIHHTYIRNMTKNMTNEEFEELKKVVYDLNREVFPCIVPLKMKKEKKEKYKISIKCPYCKKEDIIKNCFIRNKRYYSVFTACRNCGMEFKISSRLYKFTTDHYVALDFFRKNYLKVRDKFLRDSM